MEQNRVSLVNFGLKLVGMRWKLCVFGGENVIFALMNHVVSPPLILAFLPLSLGWFMPRYPSSSSCSCNDGACKIVAFPLMVVSLGGWVYHPFAIVDRLQCWERLKLQIMVAKSFRDALTTRLDSWNLFFSFKVYPDYKVMFCCCCFEE